MKEKQLQKFINLANEKAYKWAGLSMLMSMFKYDNLPDELKDKTEFLEWSLLRFGFAAVGKHKGKFYFGYVSGFEFDEYGLPIGKCEFHTRYGYTFSGTIGKDIVVGYNNNIRTPDLLIDRFAAEFAEIDKSISTAVKKTRVNPIPVATDSKVATALENAMTDIENGVTKIILKDTRQLSELVRETAEKPLETIELTAPEEVARIQYLSRLHDDMLTRFCTFYGQSLSGINKMAQVNSDEIKGYETYSKITPYIMLNARTAMLDRCNSVFGVEWSCDFSEAWAHMKKTETNSEAGKEVEE